MSDGVKGVEVVGFRGSSLVDYEFRDAATLDVRDGHLYVLGSSGAFDVIALFAPGKWQSAQLKR